MRIGSSGVVLGTKYVAKKTTGSVPSLQARCTSSGDVAKKLPGP